MAPFTPDENNIEMRTLERMESGLESEHSSPFSPMTDASTIQGVDESTIQGGDEASMSDADLAATVKHISMMKLEHKVEHYRDGWAKLAAEQNRDHNGSFFRAFAYGSNRVLHHLEGRIVNLLNQLEELDETSNSHLKCYSAWQRRKVGEEYKPDEYDLIMDELKKEMHQYFRFIHYNKETQALDGPLIHEVTGLYLDLKKRNMLDDEALAFTQAPDDFVSTRPSEGHSSHFRWLFYSRYGKKLRKLLLPSDGRGMWSVPYSTLVWVDAVGLTLFCILMLLAPVGILYLARLTDAESFLVVLLFVSAFAAAMVLTKDTKTKFRDIFFIIFGYAAVLSAFLGQIAEGG